MDEITASGERFAVRRAVADDVGAIVALLAADQIGSRRDGGDLAPYLRAFQAIDADPAQLLLVAVPSGGDAIIATAQLTFIPGLARRGSLRAQVEAVRVAESHRGSGLGTALMRWMIERSRRHGCSLVQLTSDRRRSDAHRFYERLGFIASHEGFKLSLSEDG